jgi:phosphate starvation-inducible membrane PsiE
MTLSWRKYLNIHSGEESTAPLLLAYSFVNGLTIVFAYTVALSTFLAVYSPKSLPVIYIAAACIIALTGLIYAQMHQRMSQGLMFIGPLLFLVTTAVLLRWGLARGQAK